MKSCLRLALLIHLVLITVGLSQIPSGQLKVKESSGFLGLGGAKYIELRLSNELRQQPLNSVNVNSGQFYYFECLPVGDWKLDPEFVGENLSRLTVEQNTLREFIAFSSGIRIEGDSTSILIGFSKSLKIQEPFLFRIRVGDIQYQVQFTVPIECWPGYKTIENLSISAEKALAASDFQGAISVYNAIITDNALQIFPQQAEARLKIIKSFQAYLDANTTAFQALKDSSQLDPNVRIARVAKFRPVFMYVIDSLPSLRFNLAPHDSNVSFLLDQARKAVLRIGFVTDSLQNFQDERTVRWILDGSVTGRTGRQYQYMIEALAYAFSSLDFADTNATSLTVSIPAQIQARLEKNGLFEPYATFIRLCSDRYQMRLTIFPVDFLPNLRRDTADFPLPFYSMLKAVSDYYAGNLSACKNEIVTIFRICYVPELLNRYDKLRVIANWRLAHVPSNVFRLLGEGEVLQSKHDYIEAADKYRQAVIIGSDFAYASFGLGNLYVEAGDSTLGISLFQKAYQLDTLYLSAYLESYGIYRQRKSHKSMIEVMSIALARGNDYWVTNYCLGKAFVENAEPLKALNPFRRALELNPQSYETYIQLGQAYQATKEFLKAREYFNKAIEIDALRKEAVDALNKLNEQERSIR